MMAIRAPYIIMCMIFLAVFAGGESCARAENGALTIDLVRDSIDITTGFSGAVLDIYGVIHSKEGLNDNRGNVAIVITGPSVEMVVRHKEEMLGIWMNRGSVKFDSVPAYYDIALSAPAHALAPQDYLDRLDIGLNALRFVHTGREKPAMVKRYREALIRNKQEQGYFPLKPRPVSFVKDNFFKTAFYLPPDVPTGNYTIRAFLFREGEIIDRVIKTLTVEQVGFGARLNYFAHIYSWAYGVLAILFGILAGWLAYVTMRKG